MESRLIESRFTYTRKEKVNSEVSEIETKEIDIKSNISEKIEKVQEIKTSLKTNLVPKLEKIEKKESIVMKNIKEFFSTNLLAKIGSILVFL